MSFLIERLWGQQIWPVQSVHLGFRDSQLKPPEVSALARQLPALLHYFGNLFPCIGPKQPSNRDEVAMLQQTRDNIFGVLTEVNLRRDDIPKKLLKASG